MLIPSNMVFLSMLSRIWACCRGLCMEVERWYHHLTPVTDILQPTEVAWLPEEETLPADLTEWLREQGFTAGLTPHTQEGGDNDDDVLESLMSQLQGQNEEENKGEPPVDTSLPVDSTLLGTMEEDLGDPVDVRRKGARNRENDTSGLHDQQQQGLPMTGKTGVREKINNASTIHDLQRILRTFQKKCPQAKASRKAEKCATFLANLQSRSRLVDGQGKEAQLQTLLIQGRKKIIKFFRSLSSNSDKAGGAKNKKKMKKNGKMVGKKMDETKSKKKANGKLVGKKTDETKKANGKVVGKKTDGREMDETNTRKKANGKMVDKKMNETKTKKKPKKNSKAGVKETDRKKQANVVSASRREKLPGGKRKKDNLGNNRTKKVQVKQKKKSARKV